MGLLKYIHVYAFFIGLAFGIFAVYVTQPKNRKILVYPTPENIDLLQYKDATGHCFEFRSKLVECPVNDKHISTIPIQ